MTLSLGRTHDYLRPGLKSVVKKVKMTGNADEALERLKADEALDVSSQLQSARLAYFQALDTNEGLDRAKFTCLCRIMFFLIFDFLG
jgi:hypothetical protein